MNSPLNHELFIQWKSPYVKNYVIGFKIEWITTCKSWFGSWSYSLQIKTQMYNSFTLINTQWIGTSYKTNMNLQVLKRQILGINLDFAKEMHPSASIVFYFVNVT